MAGSAPKTDPDLWQAVKDEVTAGDKGGNPGQWSARKAQLAARIYQDRGGSYAEPKADDNALQEWTDQNWGTKSGEPSGKTGERYLPQRERERLSEDEYRRTTDNKRADTADGKQHSPQPEDVRKKTSAMRRGDDAKADDAEFNDAEANQADANNAGDAEPTKADLYAEARARDIPGRSKMNKGDLARALEET
jgi:hypothetical protein